MLPPFIWTTLLLIPVGFVFIVPVIAALLSRLDKYPRKIWWVLLSLVFNWFGYFAWYYLCIKRSNRSSGPADEMDS